MNEVMFIDGQPLSDYGAKLLDWKPGAPNITNTLSTGTNYALPRLLRSELQPRPLSITVNIYDKFRTQADAIASRLIQRLNRETELRMPDGFIYRSVLQSVSETIYPAKWIAEFTMNFLSVKHGQYQEFTVTTNNTPFIYDGTAPAGYRIEFTVPSVTQNITVQGISINTIPAGAVIVIDGLEKTIIQNGANKFKDSNLVDFPIFKPDLPITFSASPFVPLKIGYYPTYI